MRKILCVGPQWRGSNAAALFKAFSRLGYIVDVVDENYYINLNNHKLLTKVIDKIFFHQHVMEFNEAVSRSINIFRPDLILVYKGAFVLPGYLKQWKLNGPVINVYPDVSYRSHGKHLPHSLPLYDWIFTTKTFGLSDMKSDLNISNASFVPHGFDPEIHRPLTAAGELKKQLTSQVSFIGTHSPKKEHYLSALLKAIPTLDLKIWGNGWQRSTAVNLNGAIQYRELLGDLYAMAINASAINLGILSEQVMGASSGDLITSRTFHIPAAGGFLLHERTTESITYFKEGSEAAFFLGEEELIQQVKYYIVQDIERRSMADKGKQRAWAQHSIDQRAESLLTALKEKKIVVQQ
ncbi:MAG: glycosyltransferase [Cytophagaceae bacterium]|nr:glycosyltransferase [Cytophagaceae bacterium]